MTETLIPFWMLSRDSCSEMLFSPWGHTARMGQSRGQPGPTILHYTRWMGLDSTARASVPTVNQVWRDGLGAMWPSFPHCESIHCTYLAPGPLPSKNTLDRQRCYWFSWLAYPTSISILSPPWPPQNHTYAPPVCFTGEQLFLPSLSDFPDVRMRPSLSFTVQTGDSLAPG